MPALRASGRLRLNRVGDLDANPLPRIRATAQTVRSDNLSIGGGDFLGQRSVTA